MSKPLIVVASIAPLQSAIMIASDGGARIKLDIPESEMGKIAALMALRGKVLKVAIEAVKPSGKQVAQEWGDDGEDDDTR